MAWHREKPKKLESCHCLPPEMEGRKKERDKMIIFQTARTYDNKEKGRNNTDVKDSAHCSYCPHCPSMPPCVPTLLPLSCLCSSVDMCRTIHRQVHRPTIDQP